MKDNILYAVTTYGSYSAEVIGVFGLVACLIMKPMLGSRSGSIAP